MQGVNLNPSKDQDDDDTRKEWTLQLEGTALRVLDALPGIGEELQLLQHMTSSEGPSAPEPPEITERKSQVLQGLRGVLAGLKQSEPMGSGWDGGALDMGGKVNFLSVLMQRCDMNPSSSSSFLLVDTR